MRELVGADPANTEGATPAPDPRARHGPAMRASAAGVARRKPAVRHLAMGLGVVLVWSACFVVIEGSRGDAPPALYAALRALLGGLPLLALAARRRVMLPPPGTWGWILLLAVTNTTIGLGAMFVSVGLAGAAVPAVLANSQALLVAPVAAAVFGERLTAGRFTGIVLGLVGVGLTWSAGAEVLGSREGAAVALLGAAALAVANLVTKHIGARVEALTATAWQYVLGAVPLLAWSFAVEDPRQMAWSWPFVAGLLFLGLVGSAAASWVWYGLVRDGELLSLNALTLLTPPLAFALAVAIYREPVTARALIGIGAVLAGVAWVTWPRDLVVTSGGIRERPGAR
jgi:drug/metabolite transporter (DMT)-like permease